MVVAPSLTPKKPGDRVKTNRRDGVSLARLARAGELTAVWVPDERHEAMRDLSRARQAAQKDLQGKRQQISSLTLGRIYPGKKTWGPARTKWLVEQKLEHREQRIAFEELLEGIRQESERVERLEEAIREAVPEWSLAEVVTAVQAIIWAINRGSRKRSAASQCSWWAPYTCRRHRNANRSVRCRARRGPLARV